MRKRPSSANQEIRSYNLTSILPEFSQYHNYVYTLMLWIVSIRVAKQSNSKCYFARDYLWFVGHALFLFPFFINTFWYVYCTQTHYHWFSYIDWFSLLRVWNIEPIPSFSAMSHSLYPKDLTLGFIPNYSVTLCSSRTLCPFKASTAAKQLGYSFKYKEG